MRILVLSDLHIGDKARGKDLCPYETNNWLDENYVDNFISFINKEKIKVDYMIITGDISNSGSFDEFKIGKNIISNISTALEISNNHILIIPGNHDVDWNVLKISSQSESDKQYRRSQRYDAFKHNFKNEFDIEQLVVDPYFTCWEFDDLFVIGFNSSFHDEHNSNVHHGLISNDIIGKIDEFLKTKDFSSKIKLFISHHHLYQYSDPISELSDFSIMTNAENLLSLLARNKFDMVAHGHKHVPRIITHEINSIHPISMLSAGSFSVILDQKFNGSILNMFHIINFTGRDQQTDRIYGYIESYSYLSAHKWLKSNKQNSNILHKQGFGAYSSIKEMKKILIPEISNEIDQNGVAEWTKICKKISSLNYHTPEFISALTNEIVKDLNIKKFENESEIIFLKHDE